MKSKILFGFFFLLILGNVFGQTFDLALTYNDIRIEESYNNGVSGYSIFIRKKPDIESVILTEPSGAYALRATAWNSVNGNEQRQLSGVTLRDKHSQYSIVSSTPQPDTEFGRAFVLFIPTNVVYGNPTSRLGTVYLNINRESQINIRTFPHRFADPISGRYQNNQFKVGDNINYLNIPTPQTVEHPRTFNRINEVRSYLQEITFNSSYLKSLDNDQLETFLRNTFLRMDREQPNK